MSNNKYGFKITNIITAVKLSVTHGYELYFARTYFTAFLEMMLMQMTQFLLYGLVIWNSRGPLSYIMTSSSSTLISPSLSFIEVSSLLYSRRSSNVLKKSENRQNYSQVPQPSKDKALLGWKSLHRSLSSEDTKLVSGSFLSSS